MHWISKLRCGCEIKWIVEDPRMMGVIDWPDMPDSFIARCQDGTPVRDLDPLVFENLCK